MTNVPLMRRYSSTILCTSQVKIPLLLGGVCSRNGIYQKPNSESKKSPYPSGPPGHCVPNETMLTSETTNYRKAQLSLILLLCAFFERQQKLQTTNSSHSMSWQTYVDSNLVGSGAVRKAAIIGLDGNTWATTSGKCLAKLPFPSHQSKILPPQILRFPYHFCHPLLFPLFL